MGQTNINDEKMRNLFEEGISKIRNAENKDGVIVIGNTGAGKSTLINYLLGCKMVYKKKKGNKTYETAENEFAKIGHKALTS
jgi:putative ribosome biogenesis GTPase RsgA